MSLDLTLDPWTPLDYKKLFGAPGGLPGAINAPYLSPADRRRLSAYLVLSAYLSNKGRATLPEANRRRDDVREYGDASLVVEQALSSLLGENQKIVVAGASGHDRDRDASGHVDSAEDAAARAAADWQQRLRAWADRENFALHMMDAERSAVGLGDGVYTLWWDPDHARPRIKVWDPGMYFPVLGSDQAWLVDEFPTRVHFVYEVPAEDQPDHVARLVRLTYDLAPIRPPADLWGFPGDDGRVTLPEGDTWTADGRIQRKVPWSTDPVTVTCYMTQREWLVGAYGDMTGAGPDALDEARSRFSVGADGLPVDHIDLRIDFVPVVHVPNTWPGESHYGTSVITKTVQALDDLQAADTDSQLASSTAGSPIIAASGVATRAQGARRGGGTGGTLTIRPGLLLELGENGRLTTVDTSNGLRELRAYVEDLRGRYTQNARIPDVALGLVGSDANAMSGLAIELRYGPMQSLIRAMRLVRGPKYSVLLRFVQRMMMLDPHWDGPTATADASVVLGSFMPRDLAGTLERVAKAVSARIISLETGILLLQQAGLPIDDVAEEIRRIEARDFKGAGDLADAIGSGPEVRRYLGLPPVPAEPAVPPVPLGSAALAAAQSAAGQLPAGGRQ